MRSGEYSTVLCRMWFWFKLQVGDYIVRTPMPSYSLGQILIVQQSGGLLFGPNTYNTYVRQAGGSKMEYGMRKSIDNGGVASGPTAT